MERSSLEILNTLAETRRHFFRRSPMYRRDQEEITLNFISSEREYIQLLTQLNSRDSRPVVFSIPLNIPNNFLDSVPVVATQTQINNEIVDFEATTQVACAICQDSISSGGCQLRVCGHHYHQSCIRTWFCASSLCPVCRRDIREDPQAQTSSVSSETSPQDMSQ
jgi:hypothetical protein